jgi:HK97 family phage major capsid protein
MNQSQYALRLKSLKAWGDELNAKVKQVETKSYRGCHNQLKQDLADYFAEKETLDWHAKRLNVDAKGAAMAQSGGDLGNRPGITTKSGPLSNLRPGGQPITTTGGQLQPLEFDANAISVLAKSYESKTPVSTLVSTKAFNTVESGFTLTTPSLLPAELAPGVVERIHEDRVLDHIPAIGCSTLNYEFIKDSTSSDAVTGTTAEGATAPDVTLSYEAITVAMVAIKATFGLSVEVQADWGAILGYTQNEVFRQVVDTENSQILTATGSTGNMNGLINQAANTIAVPTTLATGVTALDYVLQGINTLRTVPNVLAVADQIWLHPNDWYSLVGLKDGLNRYMITPDPTQDAPKKLFNIPVYTTTAMTAGTAVLLDSTKFGFGIIRQGIQLFQGYNDLDFSQFISRYALLWRGQLAVVRPGAILTVTGLPTSPFTPPAAS